MWLISKQSKYNYFQNLSKSLVGFIPSTTVLSIDFGLSLQMFLSADQID